MKKVILDTNFILNCVSQKIDFFNDIKNLGIKLLIPKQVINELNKIAKDDRKLKFRNAAELALRIMEVNNENYSVIDLAKYARTTDNAIVRYANKNKDVIVATLDRDMKRKITGKKMFIRGLKTLEII